MDDSDQDYLTEYRMFFDIFFQRVDLTHPLPVSIANYNISDFEITGEVVNWCIQYLNDRNCPPSLVAPLCRSAVLELEQVISQEPEKCGYRSKEDDYQPLRLMQMTIKKLVDVCLRYRDNCQMSQLPAPKPMPSSSAAAAKNVRRTMEDRHIVIDDLHSLFGLKGCGSASYYGVFDGHNGFEAAFYACAHLHQYLVESKHYPHDPAAAFKEAYLRADSCFIDKANKENLKSGTTAVSVLIRHDTGLMYVAWLGDSQAILVRKREYIQLVNPHRPEHAEERKRIEKMGGSVVYWGTWRVNGQLAVSRAIGDIDNKPYVTGEPDVITVTLRGDEDFLLLACDGLWDVVSEEKTVEEVYRLSKLNGGDRSGVCTGLVSTAKSEGSKDNISVVLAWLDNMSSLQNGHHPAPGGGVESPALLESPIRSALLLDHHLPAIPPRLEEKSRNWLSTLPWSYADAVRRRPPEDEEAVTPKETPVPKMETAELPPSPPSPTAVEEPEVPTSTTKEIHEVIEEEEVGDVAVGEGDSGEDSEEEWNYISGKDNKTRREQELKNTQELSPEEMEWQLNPNAAEFVPVLGADTTMARSPTKDSEQNMDDIQLPTVAEFCKKAASRPSDIEPMCNENETTLNGINLTGLSTKALFDEDSIALNTSENSSLLQDEPALKDTNPFCVRSPNFVPDHFSSSDQLSKPFGVETSDSEFDIIRAEDVQPADSKKEPAESKDISELVFGDGINLDQIKAKTEVSGVQNGLDEEGDSDLEDRPDTPLEQIVTVHQEDTLSPFVTLRPSQGGPLVEEDQGFVGSEPDNASPAEEEEADNNGSELCRPDELSEGKESLVCSEDELPQPSKTLEPQGEKNLACPIKTADFSISDSFDQIEKKNAESVQEEENLVCPIKPSDFPVSDSFDQFEKKNIESVQEEKNLVSTFKSVDFPVSDSFDQIDKKHAVKEEELVCTFELRRADELSEGKESLVDSEDELPQLGKSVEPQEEENLVCPIKPAGFSVSDPFDQIEKKNDMKEVELLRTSDKPVEGFVCFEKDEIYFMQNKYPETASSLLDSFAADSRDILSLSPEKPHSEELDSNLSLRPKDEPIEGEFRSQFETQFLNDIAEAAYAGAPVFEKKEEESVHITSYIDEHFIHEKSLLKKEEDIMLSTNSSRVEELVCDMLSSPVQQKEVPAFSDEMSSSMIDHGTGTLEEKSLPEAQSNQLDLVQELAFEPAKVEEKPKEADTESDSGFEIINPSEASTIEHEESILAVAAASEKEAAAVDEKLLMDKNEAETLNVNGVVTPPTTPAPGAPSPENKEGLIAAAVAAVGVATAVATGAAAVAAVADKKVEDKKLPTTPPVVQKAAVGKPSQAKPGTKAPVGSKTLGSKPAPGAATKPASKPSTPTNKVAPAKTITSPSKTAGKPLAKPATTLASKPKPAAGTGTAAAAKPAAAKPAAPASSSAIKKPTTSLTQRPTSAPKTATSAAKPAAPKPAIKTATNTTAAKPAAPRPPSATAKTAASIGSKPPSARPMSGGSKASAPSKPAAVPAKISSKPAAAKPTTTTTKTAAPAKPSGTAVTKASPGTKPPLPALKTSPASLNKRPAAPTAIKKPAPATDKSIKEANNKLASAKKGVVSVVKKGAGGGDEKKEAVKGLTQEPEVTTSTQCILPPPLENGTQIC